MGQDQLILSVFYAEPTESEIIVEKLTRQDLYSLERYSEMREEFRNRVIEHKHNRIVHLGPNATLYFEDRLTMQLLKIGT